MRKLWALDLRNKLDGAVRRGHFDAFRAKLGARSDAAHAGGILNSDVSYATKLHSRRARISRDATARRITAVAVR